MRGNLAALSAFAVLATAAGARADEGPLYPFNVEYRQRIEMTRCPAAYAAANAIARRGGDVDAASGHGATRAFLDCAELSRLRLVRTDYEVVLAGASEMLAARHEAGAAAQRSLRNAVTLLTPIGGRGFPNFDVSYRDAAPGDGPNALVASVENVPVVGHDDPSPLATIANILAAQARAGIVPAEPAAP